MNAYDFDDTIFCPDSSYTFVMYCLQRFPLTVLKRFPAITAAGIKYKLGKIETKELKETIFSFLAGISNVDETVREFWETHQDGIGEWYLGQKREDDLIISASPEFLLQPVAKQLGVRLIATPMDKNTGKITGLNCHDKEKVRRFRETYPGEHIESFYSDSLSDTPMAELADNAFLVNKGQLSPWPFA